MLNLRYRTVPLKHTLDMIFRAAGHDPFGAGITPRETADYVDHINMWLRQAWDEDFPQLRVCQRRAFRAPWRPELGYVLGDEVWSGGRYWRCRAGASTLGEPPAKGNEEWREIGWRELNAYLSLSNEWDAIDIGEGGFDLAAFMFLDDPVCNASPRAVTCRQFADCIAPTTRMAFPDGMPWCVFKPDVPRLAAEVWDPATLYGAGHVVYRPETGRCYVAMAPTGGQEGPAAPPEQDPAVWSERGVPEMFETYIVLGATAGLAAEGEGKWKTRALADDELKRIMWVKTGGAGNGGRARARRR